MKNHITYNENTIKLIKINSFERKNISYPKMLTEFLNYCDKFCIKSFDNPLEVMETIKDNIIDLPKKYGCINVSKNFGIFKRYLVGYKIDNKKNVIRNIMKIANYIDIQVIIKI